MRRLTVAGVLACLAAGGCNGSPSTGPRLWGLGRAASAGGRSGQVEAEEAEFTILLCVLNDPLRHAEHAATYKKNLQEREGWKGLFVVNQAGHSALYWGQYATADAAQDNLAKAKAYIPPNPQAGAIFAQALVVPLPGGDLGPPEWDLRKAEGAYTLLVAVFKNLPEKKYMRRRERAVEFCTKLRQAGYEAYWHHGRGVSNVTVGTFGPDSVRPKQTPTGAQLDILDPEIQTLQARFPHLLLNGNSVTYLTRDPRTDEVIGRETRRTHLVRIPGRSEGHALR